MVVRFTCAGRTGTFTHVWSKGGTVTLGIPPSTCMVVMFFFFPPLFSKRYKFHHSPLRTSVLRISPKRRCCTSACDGCVRFCRDGLRDGYMCDGASECASDQNRSFAVFGRKRERCPLHSFEPEMVHQQGEPKTMTRISTGNTADLTLLFSCWENAVLSSYEKWTANGIFSSKKSCEIIR